MAMNLGLQKHTVEKKLRNRGINPDRIDLEAELDSTLSLPENIQNLEEKYGRIERTGRNSGARQERAQARRRKQAQQEAKKRHRKRPKYNRYIDQTKNAEKTFADPTERQMKKWKQNPNKYDIKGVDTRTGSERRPQTELPIQRRRDKILYEGDESDLRKSMKKIPASIKKNAEGKIRNSKKKALRSQEKLMNLSNMRKEQSLGRSDPVDFYKEDLEMEKKIQKKKKGLNVRERMLRKSGVKVDGNREKLKTGKFGEKLQASEGSRASKILNGSEKGGKTLSKWEDNYI